LYATLPACSLKAAPDSITVNTPLSGVPLNGVSL